MYNFDGEYLYSSSRKSFNRHGTQQSRVRSVSGLRARLTPVQMAKLRNLKARAMASRLGRVAPPRSDVDKMLANEEKMLKAKKAKSDKVKGKGTKEESSEDTEDTEETADAAAEGATDTSASDAGSSDSDSDSQ